MERRCRVRLIVITSDTIANNSAKDPYGSTESTRVDGKGVSALVTWDSKVTTVLSLMNGVVDLVRERMKSDGIYNEFLKITEASSPRRIINFCANKMFTA